MNKSASQVCAERIAMLEGALAESNTALALKFQEVKSVKESLDRSNLTTSTLISRNAKLEFLRDRDADTIAKLVKAL